MVRDAARLREIKITSSPVSVRNAWANERATSWAGTALERGTQATIRSGPRGEGTEKELSENLWKNLGWRLPRFAVTEVFIAVAEGDSELRE